MISSLLRFLKPLSSLRLTIVCLACCMVLLFAGTLDQVHVGIFEAQNRYFKSFLLFFTIPGAGFKVPWFPGGYTLGIVLLANLIAAHATRFRFSWRKTGIIVLHSGIILLLVGQLVTSIFQVESQMRLDQGQTSNFSESPYFDELAIIDESGKDFDQVTSIPASDLHRGADLKLPGSDVAVHVNDFYQNAFLINPGQLPSPNYPHLKLGPMAVAVAAEPTYKQDERNQPATSVTISANGQPVGTWSLSAAFPTPIRFQVEGRNYQLVLRPKRYYKPFSVTLEQFRHDRYAGTDIANNFSSKVRLVDPSGHENREALIFMNHPLRYSGLTFYQAGFDNNDNTTILQVVKNPSWLTPYISCALIVLGLVIQFGMHLTNFIRRRVIA